MVTTTNLPTDSSSSASKPQVKLPLRVKKGIKERYDPNVDDVLSKLRSQTGQPSLTLVPNFETNYAPLAAFDSTLDRSKGDDDAKLSEYWQDSFGQATLAYFEGLLWRLEGDKFGDDDTLREAWIEATPEATVEVRIVDKLDKDSEFAGCDCVLENGRLVIRTTVERWFQNPTLCCENLVKLL